MTQRESNFKVPQISTSTFNRTEEVARVSASVGSTSDSATEGITDRKRKHKKVIGKPLNITPSKKVKA